MIHQKAPDAVIFKRINRPSQSITFKKIIAGLVKLRAEFKGKIWLEVMLVGGINDSLVKAKMIKEIIEKIKPDKLQLNLPVRPQANKIKLTSSKKLTHLSKLIGWQVELVSGYYDGRKQFGAK